MREFDEFCCIDKLDFYVLQKCNFYLFNQKHSIGNYLFVGVVVVGGFYLFAFIFRKFMA